MQDVKLTPTAYVVLGLLSFGMPLSGYEIRQWANGALADFYPAPAQSQIYAELAKLESQGLVEGSAVSQQDRPDKVSFVITSAGAAALERWAETEVPQPSIKHHVALRVFLGHATTPDVLIPILEAHRDRVLTALDQLETQSVALTGDPGAGYAAAVADWMSEMYRGDLRGVEQTLKMLAEVPGHQ